jgi:hypothetical protein
MSKDEALKFAVKALLPLIKRAAPYGEDDWLDGKKAVEKCNAALAQPTQDYVAKNPLGGPAKVFDAMANAIRAGDTFESVLRTYGFAVAQPAQESRPWVGLTDDEMEALWGRYAHLEMMRAIEQALKEKNT